MQQAANNLSICLLYASKLQEVRLPPFRIDTMKTLILIHDDIVGHQSLG